MSEIVICQVSDVLAITIHWNSNASEIPIGHNSEMSQILVILICCKFQYVKF